MSKSTTTREGLENSPSSATVTCSDFYQSQTPPPPCSPSRVSRLVSFSAEPSFPMSPQISSSYNNNSSSSTVFDFVPAAAAGTAKGSSPPPSPSQTPTTTRSRSRNRSRSRISHSGSMVNLMNLVRSTSSMSRSRTEGAASRSVLGLGDVGTEGQSRMSPSVGMEVSMSMSMSMGWFGKACSFIRPWGDGSGHAGDTTGGGEWTVSDSSEENTPASEERKQAFEETHKVTLTRNQTKTMLIPHFRLYWPHLKKYWDAQVTLRWMLFSFLDLCWSISPCRTSKRSVQCSSPFGRGYNKSR